MDLSVSELELNLTERYFLIVAAGQDSLSICLEIVGVSRRISLIFLDRLFSRLGVLFEEPLLPEELLRITFCGYSFEKDGTTIELSNSFGIIISTRTNGKAICKTFLTSDPILGTLENFIVQDDMHCFDALLKNYKIIVNSLSEYLIPYSITLATALHLQKRSGITPMSGAML